MRIHEERAFREYVEANRSYHYRMAFTLCGNHHDAEDVVQYALEKLYQRWPRVARNGSPRAYTHKIVANRFIDTKRSASVRHEEFRAEVPDDVADATLIADLVVDSDLLGRCLTHLPPRQRVALVSHYGADLTVEEVARMLGLSRAHTYRCINEGLVNIRALIEKWTCDE